jgi:prepilin-type N-terminal cleavage/methylation domain-containing protein
MKEAFPTPDRRECVASARWAEAHRSTRTSGFSLAEVLVAVALLAVIMLALFSLVSMGVQRAYSGRKMTESSMLAQTVMERVNVYEPHLVLTTNTGLETISQTWTKKPSGVTSVPALATGTTYQATEQLAIQTLMENATQLQVYADRPATLTVSMTATPATKTFANASMVRVVVHLTWYEWGTRKREVRLQALNLRKTP